MRHVIIKYGTHCKREQHKSQGKATWHKLVPDAMSKFEKLLAGRTSESQVQVFLEQHPYLLPGIDLLHHGPLEGIVATKFQLGNAFQTDFAFISSNSQEICLTCVEIESPKKQLFRKDGAFSRSYLDAKQQITDWLFWASHNIDYALESWLPLFPGLWKEIYTVKFQSYLIIGRRTEINDRKKQERWAGEAMSLGQGLTTMTYDRLIKIKRFFEPDMDNDKIAVCSYRDRQFLVKTVCA